MDAIDGTEGGKRHAIVFNQFALPRSAPGGTRHVELYGQMPGWNTRVIAGARGMLDQEKIESDDVLETVWVSRYKGNGIDRILNWCSYCVTAFFRGLSGPKPDVVIGSSPHLGAALVAWLVARIRRAHFALEIRDLWPEILSEAGSMPKDSLAYRTLDALARLLYRNADEVFVLAAGSRDTIERAGVAPEHIRFVPNGADPSDFEVAESSSKLRATMGLPGVNDDSIVVVYAGAHGPANGLDFAIDAMAEISESAPDLHLILVGGGVDKQRLQQRVATEDVRNVHFLAPIPKDEIPSVFGAADIGLHCLADVPLFHYGVSPNKLYDYMAAGLAVITNTPGDVAQLVDDARSGLAVAPTELASGLQKLISASREERQAMGEAGRDFMALHRSRRAMANEMARTLSTLIDRKNSE